jgi:hypothetical protein
MSGIAVSKYSTKKAFDKSSSFINKNKNKYITDMCSCYTIAWRCKLQKECTQLAAASDKAYQLLAHGRWFSGFFHHYN